MTYTSSSARSICENATRFTDAELAAELANADNAVETAKRGGSQARLAARVQGTLQYETDKRTGRMCANCAEMECNCGA